jgi:phenylalanyl-tRNA synthetase beta chain
MQILIPDLWLREYLETDASPKQIQEALSLSGPSIERLHDNNVYDIEVTTNRPDLMSVFGIAQEAMAILPRFKHKAKLLKNPFNQKRSLTLTKKVNYLQVIVDPKLCYRFTAVLIKDVKVKESPKELIKKLELAGMRGLNNVVDISNLLMHETGQPVHTFDYDKISGHKMVLRESKKGEKLTTLDGKTHNLSGGDIVIEDGEGRLIDLCGIMGAENSAVDGNTKNVLLFLQTYEPTHIRRTSMDLAHRTTAAVLFEKGLPVENVPPVIDIGIQLFKEIAGGTAEKEVLDILTAEPVDIQIKFSKSMDEFISSRLGVDVDMKQIKDILTDLGFEVVTDKLVKVPFRRKNDVSIPEDLVEEVARIYGYHNLPSELMTGALPVIRNDKIFEWERKIKDRLAALGFTETYTYSLVDRDDGLSLKNPLSSEWAYLRTSLVPSHQEVIKNNLGKVQEVNIFEIANVYIPTKASLPEEKLHLAISSSNKDQYRLKGIVESLFQSLMGISIPFDVSEYEEGITFEVFLTPLIDKIKTKRYQPISKYPPIIEDINIIKNDSYTNIVKNIKEVSDLIKDVQLIDIYKDKLTLRLTFHSDTRQLASIDVAPIREKLGKLFSSQNT